ncbi:sulfotransferase family 2 domain-containing protein [Marinoscillum sp. MHG1-6]|uniref:sulfotransferase family 2 domain-containing protein n=1 Tax=Marinoscillum sp. MHG1-6 TaxID=2959627 RepID=UPI0021579F8B|nr:sulfotransferase family 2 domain-containing protein [Marinoscillum sp. MHG1-6]
MLITDQIIFFELQKTGCTHTRRILSTLYADNHQIIGKHNAYDTVPKKVLGDFEGKTKVGNIRNPWDWYISLWAYGCQHRGGLYRRVALNNYLFLFSKKRFLDLINTGPYGRYPKLDTQLWQQVYSDVNNYENFNAWLKLVLQSKEHGIGEGFKIGNISQFAGLMTFRYFQLYAYRKKLNSVHSLKELRDFDQKENFMDVIIRNENLHSDLLENVDKLKCSQEELTKVLGSFAKRTNTSERDKDYRKYYDEESVKLVQQKEKFIIEKYGYSFG